MSAPQHLRRSSYLETYQLGYRDLVFGTDYRGRQYCVRPYDDHHDGYLTWRNGGYGRYRNSLTIIRLSDGAKFFAQKHAAYWNGYANTDQFARKCLSAMWCAR
jgi:hypothetical protein